MRGPCLCGDICCPSCGPAQGNSQCPECGAWLSEGCEHYADENENEPFYSYSARKWFFHDENGKAIGPYDSEDQAAKALYQYSIEITQN